MASIDQQFVEYIVKSIVEHPDDVQIERKIDERGVLLTLTVNPEDLGRLIGKHGMTAQSLRSLLRTLGNKNDARYNLKIANNDDRPPREYDDRGDESKVAVDSVTDEAVEKPVSEAKKSSKKIREELAELDDLDI